MNLVRLGAACCALLLVVACGAEAVSDAAQDRLQPFGEEPTSVSSSESGPGRAQAIGDGLAATVSAPKPFTPTEAASPRAARAVAFDLLIENRGTEVYRPSELSITATCASDPLLQVIDSTQGYTGLVGSAEEIPPEQRLRLAVAFALPAERCALRLTVQADAVDGQRVTVFEGGV